MPQVKHMVLLRLKSGTSAQDVARILQALADLRGKCPGLLDFSGGPYSSAEGLQKGYHLGFSMTFADEKSRDIYLEHPDHEAVKNLINPHLEGGLDGVVAFDYLM